MRADTAAALLRGYFGKAHGHFGLSRGYYMIGAQAHAGASGASQARRKQSKSVWLCGVAAFLANGAVHAQELPVSGQITSGAATIAQSGNAMTIIQSTPNISVDWQSFNIGQGASVDFVQPSASAVALNRVLGPDVSTIQGALTANGQVYLINPNGVLFTPTAQVNVGGIVASTLDLASEPGLTVQDFRGGSAGAVINRGNIVSAPGGTVALIAAKVENAGTINATGGKVLFGAGSDVTLDMGGLVKLKVNRGALNALISNSGRVSADGGSVVMAAKAAGDLLGTVINNGGIVQARTLITGEKGDIRLLGDMTNGSVVVGGALDVSAPSGDAGFIETSGAEVQIADGAQVTMSAAAGKVGAWLIDPTDVTIDAVAAGTISGALATGNVTITTNSAGLDSGDIFVNSPIAKAAGAATTTLTLEADRNITVSSAIKSTAAPLNIVLTSDRTGAGVGGVKVLANLISNGGDITIGGGNAHTLGGSLVSGFAQNFFDGTNYGPGVLIGAGVKVLSQGAFDSFGSSTVKGTAYTTYKSVGTLGDGAITIRGATSRQGSDSGTNVSAYDVAGLVAGVTIQDNNSMILSGINSLTIEGVSTRYVQEFGVAFLGVTGDTYFGSSYYDEATSSFYSPAEPSSGGAISIKGWNTGTDADAQNTHDEGAFHFQQFGQTDKLWAMGLYLNNLGIKVNGTSQNIIGTIKTYPGCKLPTCGYVKVPTANGSYPFIGFSFLRLSPPQGIVINVGDGSKIYNGSLTASGLTPSFEQKSDSTAASASLIVDASKFLTSSPDAGLYTSLNYDGTLLTSYIDSGNGKTYAVSYIYGDYTINKADLAITVAGIYNGTTTFTPSNAVITTNGLAANDTLTSVTVANANVAGNTTNYVTAIAGTTTNASGTFNPSNYNYNVSYNYALGGSGTYTGQTVTGADLLTGTNAVWINRAPLGIALTAPYSGTTTVVPSAFTTSGLVNSETLSTLSSATLANANVASPNNYVVSVTKGTGTADLANYRITPTYNAALTAGGAANSNTTNVATLMKAALGIVVSGTYNGTTTYSSGIVAKGLLNGEAISSVTVADANVAGNTANYVTTFTGTANPSNYNYNVTYNYALGGSGTYTGQTVTGADLLSGTNAVIIKRAPLDVNIVASYTGYTTVTPSEGSTYGTSANGWVGPDRDAPPAITSAMLVDPNVFATGNSVISISAGAQVVASALTGGVTLTGANGGNYYLYDGPNGRSTDGSPLNTVTLHAAKLGITVNAAYSGSTAVNPTAFTTNGLLGSDTLLTLTSATLNNANVSGNGSNYVVSAVKGGGTADLRNYTLTQAYNAAVNGSGAATSTTTNVAMLTRAPLGIALDAVYSGSTTVVPTAFTTSGLLGSDTLTTLTGATLADANVTAPGNYVVAVSKGTGTVDLNNYVISPAYNAAVNGSGAATNGTTNVARLSPASLTIAADNQFKQAGALDPTLTWKITSGQLFNSDKLSGGLARDPGEAPGAYVIKQGTLGNSNYSIRYSAGALTIAPPPPNFQPQPVPQFPINGSAALGTTKNLTYGPGGLQYVNLGTTIAVGAEGEPGSGKTRVQGTADALNGNKTSVPSAKAPLDVVVMDGGVNIPQRTKRGQRTQ